MLNSEFKNAIKTIVLGRCKLKQSIYDKYIDNSYGWNTLEAAFTHASVPNKENYELLEFEGDVMVNATVVEYIRTKYPKIINVGFITRVKHNLVSKSLLSKISLKLGLFKFVEMSDEYKHAAVPGTSYYTDINEDVVESLLGAIKQLLNKSAMGIAYKACYNFMSSFLDEMKIDIDYDKVFDPKSRLKQLMDYQQCPFPSVLKTYEISEGSIRDVTTKHSKFVYKDTILTSINSSRLLNDDQKKCYTTLIKHTTSGFICIGYVCVKDKGLHDILVVSTDNKKDMEHDVSELLLEHLKDEYNIVLKPVDPFTRSKLKTLKKL